MAWDGKIHQQTLVQVETYPTDGEVVEVRIRVDSMFAGTGRGRTLGRALVAAGLDMMQRDSIDLIDALVDCMELRRSRGRAGLDYHPPGAPRS